MRPFVAAATEDIGEPAVNIAIFAVFVVITLGIVFRASRNNRTAADYYAAGRAFERFASSSASCRLPSARRE